MDEYKLTPKRVTNELESDDTTTPTKKVQLWGWDGTSKVKVAVDADGKIRLTDYGALLEQTALSISSAVSSAGISVGKAWMMIQNAGTVDVYFGSSAVSSANSPKCYPAQNYVFDNCPSDFKVYFVTEVASASTIKILER